MNAVTVRGGACSSVDDKGKVGAAPSSTVTVGTVTVGTVTVGTVAWLSATVVDRGAGANAANDCATAAIERARLACTSMVCERSAVNGRVVVDRVVGDVGVVVGGIGTNAAVSARVAEIGIAVVMPVGDAKARAAEAVECGWVEVGCGG